jgi:hypothetical protein
MLSPPISALYFRLLRKLPETSASTPATTDLLPRFELKAFCLLLKAGMRTFSPRYSTCEINEYYPLVKECLITDS